MGPVGKQFLEICDNQHLFKLADTAAVLTVDFSH